MNLPQWYAEVALRQPDLFRLIGDFHSRPQMWAHPDRLAILPHKEVLTYLANSPTGQKHASRWVTAQLGIAHVPAWWDFTPPRRRLVLMNSATLEKLACYCGAALQAARIGTIIARQQTVDLKEAIGAAAHAFALRRGRLMPVPSLPQLTAEATGNFGQQVLASGWAVLLGMLSNEPPELLRRFWIKLPPLVSRDSVPKLAEEECDQVWTFVRRVGNEVFTKEEQACFA
ncbi:MAG TPA: SctK family type III secretion system sorting platform protein [Verrucomicrobium sp.]|nr:SctK family type III secretion system sorting platform protein [Verrucomicrobium sp.]